VYLGAFVLGLLSVGILKPMVTLLAAWLLGRVCAAGRAARKPPLGALASPAHAEARVALAAGLAAFLVSELTCAVEIYILLEPHRILRPVHAYSSALGAALLLYGVALALDGQVIHYFSTARPCVFTRSCGVCTLRAGGACKYRHAFVWGLCLVAVMAVPVLFAPVHELLADPAAVALPFPTVNAAFDQKAVPFLEACLPRWTPERMIFSVPREMTLAEFRHIPLVAAVLALAAVALSSVRKWERAAFLVACLAAGGLAYSYLEVAVYALIPHVYIGQLGHETAEILGLALLWCVLHELFRRDQ
jgi:hypothetical protein